METRTQGSPSIFGTGMRIRKSARYDLDDFALSMTPSSNEEGSFFHHVTPVEPRESMYDRINKELGGVVENGSCSLTPETIPGDTVPKQGFSASLSFGISGISLERAVPPITEDQTSDTQSNLSATVNGHTDTESVTTKSTPQRRIRKTSLLEGKHLDREVLLEAFKGFAASAKEGTESTTAPVALPHLDPIPQPSMPRRKISAPPSLAPHSLMDTQKPSFSNFFFSGALSSLKGSSTSLGSGDLGSSHSNSENTLVSVNKADSIVTHQGTTTSVQGTNNNLQEGMDNLTALESKPRVHKRRPKPSALREMNFWSPQSM